MTTEVNLLSTQKTLALDPNLQPKPSKSPDHRRYRLSNIPEENDPLIMKDMLLKNSFMHKQF